MTDVGEVLIEGPVVYFTGAGISVGAGLPTYRGAGGLYENSSAEPPHARDTEPDRLPALWDRFRGRLAASVPIEPSAAHRHLAALELHSGLATTVITQNVDGLHSVAGSSTVHELHGNLKRIRCLDGQHTSSLHDAVWPDGGCPECPVCGCACRPDVVLFGEALPGDTWDAAAEAMRAARTVVAIGTSAVVYPAASLIRDGATASADLRIWINPESAPPDSGWAWLQGSADQQTPRLVPR
jgi:NAD-dependent deacetylase